MEGDQEEMEKLDNKLRVWLEVIQSIQRARDALNKLGASTKALDEAAYDVRMGLIAFGNQQKEGKFKPCKQCGTETRYTSTSDGVPMCASCQGHGRNN